MKEFLEDNKAQSEWSSVYLLIVFAIAALIMISLIKGMFKQSQKVRASLPVKT
ncbi:MAG: hypothetical protein JW703_04355 [Candidatus Diapherotrites archaeon]|nr:hypothetical protein [Candidatus Diapherotrites archaeon]